MPSRMSRDSRLFDETLNALRAGGNVLIPVDSGSRVLEICLAFDRHWGTKSRGRGAYNLALFCPLHKSMLGIAQQNMNFMSEELSDQVGSLLPCSCSFVPGISLDFFRSPLQTNHAADAAAWI